MSDEEKRWPFDGFYLKLAEAQREYEQEQHIDPASLTEEERQQKLQEILDWITASRKKKKEADEQLDLIVPEEEPETAGATPQPAKQYITDLVGEDYKNWHGIVVLDAGTNSGKTYESLLAKVERLDPPLLLEYLDAHLNEERYYQDWQKIFFELGHIYNKADGHAEKSLPSYTCARQWLQQYGYDLQKKRATSGELRNKNVWWVTKQ